MYLKSSLKNLLIIAFLICIFVSGSFVRAASGQFLRFEFQSLRMGTRFRIVLFGTDELAARQAATQAFERAEQLEQIFSDYREDSEVSEAERIAVRRPRVVSPLLFDLLERCLHFSRLTGGAFDITVGPVVRLWRRCRVTGRLPTTVELDRALASVGYEKVLLNPRTHSLRLTASGMHLDLGGIAKGYAADEIFRILSSSGFSRCLVDAGGDLRLGAAPPGRRGWEVRLDDELGGGEKFELEQCAIASSGDRFQFAEIDGVRYSHIVDPRTGLGVRYRGEVSVIAPDALTADALATALSVMEVSDGNRLIEGLDGVESRISREANGRVDVVRSTGFPP
jgi:thiamine biosynthesis lipoprotein